MKRVLMLCAAFWAAAANASAQTSGQGTFEIPLQWLTPAGEVQVARQNLGGSFTLEHIAGEERVRVFYDLTVDAVGLPDTLRTWLHNGGATVAFGDDRRGLEVGGSLFWRANQGQWADAGFKGVNLLALGRVRPTSSATLTASYAVYARQFADQPALDQIEHHGSVQALINLPTRTTFVARVSGGSKSYEGRDVRSTYPLPGATPHGRGWRMGTFVRVTETAVGAPGRRSQWSVLGRVAQSLADRTGAWFEYERRGTAGDLPPTIVWTPPLFYDDGVYDDPYVIDLWGWRAGVKQVFAGGAEVHGWFSYADRDYAGLDRADALTRLGATGTVPVLTRATVALDAVADYGWTRNQSSAVVEGYRAHAMSLGLRVRF